MNKPSIVFFGTPALAVTVLEELEKEGFLPDLIVTAPDKPQGRKLVLTPPPVKVWAEEKGIRVLQPAKLDDSTVETIQQMNTSWDVFIVAAYGKIIPERILDIPEKGVLNVHPSLLPKYRGASPIISQILNDEKQVGVTIMQLDPELDHGPIVAQKEVTVSPWPPKGSVLEDILAREGGSLLAQVLPQWLQGTIKAQEQEHDKATFVKKISKEDGLINLEDDPYTNFLKIQAFDIWPRAYYFVEKDDKPLRVVIRDATYQDGELQIQKVIPEGKKEVSYQDFLRSLSS